MNSRKAQWLIPVCFLVLVTSIKAQEKRSPDAPYLIPQTVFVGDQGRLVIPLDADFKDAEPVVLQRQEDLPSSEHLVIHRLELEHRGENTRLLIDFTAYIPGFVPLPSLEIPALGSTLFLSTGIGVSIASILEGESMVLSDPAPPLAIPGTSLLIYGTTLFFFLIILLGIGVHFWGKDTFSTFRKQVRQHRLIRRMGKILRTLRNDIARDKPEKTNNEEILTGLSTEFRNFLSLFTGMHCHTMTPREFMLLPSLISAESLKPYQSALSGMFLCGIFRSCDNLRFSGTQITQEALLSILEAMQSVIDALHQAEKEYKRFSKIRLETSGELI